MNAQEDIHAQLRAGELTAAIASSESAIRHAPVDPGLCFLHFELLSLAGNWTGAASQLAICHKIQNGGSPLVPVMESVVRAEIVREQVFRGEDSPAVAGVPPAWMTLLAGAFATEAKGDPAAAETARTQALDTAPEAAGALDGIAFPWLVDTDARLGPILELIIDGRYCWLSFERVRRLEFHPPEQGYHLVWRPAQLTLDAGEPLTAWMPARYPGAAAWSDDGLRLGRRTQGLLPGEEPGGGRGQKIWLTDTAEYPVLEVSRVDFSDGTPLFVTPPASP